MALNKWTSGDTITEREANNHSVRKGTEAEIAAILLADREDGDVFWNSTTGMIQAQTDATNDYRSNLAIGYDADSQEVTHTGTTPTQKKGTSFVKNSNGISGNQIAIVAEIKTDNAGTTGHFRVRHDAGGSDDLDLTTVSVTYEIKTGFIDTTGWSAGRHTLEFFMDDGTGHTISNRELEVIFI